MPSPQDLLKEMQDDPETAEQLRDQQEEMFKKASKNLPPSERERMDASFDVQGEAGSDQRLLMMKFDLTNRDDRFRVEEILAHDDVSPAGSNMEWSKNGQTCHYYLYLQVPPSFYERARANELEDPSLTVFPEREPDPKGMTPYEGWFRSFGRYVDQIVEDVCKNKG